MHSSFDSTGSTWRWLYRIGFWCVCLGLFGFAVTQEGCSCDNNPTPTDAGPTDTGPTTKGPFPTQIRFVTPVDKSVISGQITIEVEVIDGDGIEEVQFLVNGKNYLVETTRVKDSPADKPRYAVQLATGFQPRGVLNLGVQTLDKRGDKETKAISVTTRERWVAAFGVGQVRQFQVRDDGHLYLRLYRSEENIAQLTNPGPYDKVGSAIVTSSAVGTASWLYRGPGEEFSNFVLDKEGNLFMGSRLSDTGKNRLMAIGKGDPTWTSSIPINPAWETPLGDWSVKGQPGLAGTALIVHLEKPASGPTPVQSVLASFDSGSGKELWRFDGGGAISIIRGPYILSNGTVLIFHRSNAKDAKGFTAEVIAQDGSSAWKQEYVGMSLTVAAYDKASGKAAVGMEKRSGDDVSNAAVVLLDPIAQKLVWRNESGKNWPSQLSFGKDLLFAQRHKDGGNVEVVAIGMSDGKDAWAKEYVKFRIVGLQAIAGDAVYVFTLQLDDFSYATNMVIDRYSNKGDINWKYENKQYEPLNWLISADEQETLWLIVKNIDDSRELLGNKLLTLDKKGQRQYIFFEEARKNQFLFHQGESVLFLTSSDTRDARIHNLIGR